MPRKPKKKTAPKSDVKKRAEKLKAIGALNIDLRKPIKAKDAKRVNEIYRKLKDVAEHPKDYATLKASRGQVRAAKGHSFTAFGDQIFVKKSDKGVPRFKSVQLIDKRIVTSKTIHSASGKLTQKEVTDISKKLTPESIEKILNANGGKMPNGQYLMLRVGDKSPFSASIDAKQLYGSSGWEFVQKSLANGQKIGKVSIVIYKPEKGIGLLKSIKARGKKKK